MHLFHLEGTRLTRCNTFSVNYGLYAVELFVLRVHVSRVLRCSAVIDFTNHFSKNILLKILRIEIQFQ